MTTRTWHTVISRQEPVTLLKHSERSGRFADFAGTAINVSGNDFKFPTDQLRVGYSTDAYRILFDRQWPCQLSATQRRALRTLHRAAARRSPNGMERFDYSFLYVPLMPYPAVMPATR